MPNTDPPPAPPIKPPPPRRRFRLIDLMILIAATAVGFGITHWIHEWNVGFLSSVSLPDDRPSAESSSEVGEAPRQPDELLPDSPPREEPAERFIWLAQLYIICIILIEPFVAAWTIALIPIRLRKPRPSRRKLGTQPGVVAAIASTLAIGIIALLIVFLTWLGFCTTYDVGLFSTRLFLVFTPLIVGLAVLASWSTLLAGRRWRPEPYWIDRLGRIIGSYWIAAMPVTFVHSYLLTL